ncbi:MAG: response regulator [Rhodospirillaceae bacterium]|nr:response regulator [Rhodospirillales bacterium]
MPGIIRLCPRHTVAVVLLLATLAVTGLAAHRQWDRHIQKIEDYRAFELREMQESMSSLHRELSMVNLLIASADGPNANTVTDYLMARRHEFSPVRWLGYVPAPGEAPRMLLGSAVMTQFDYRHDPALTALLGRMADSNPAAGVPETYREVASLALTLPAPGKGERAALVALVDMNDLLHETMREIDHLPLRFEFTLNGMTVGQWPPGPHDPNHPHVWAPLSVGTAHFAVAFSNPSWLADAGALSVLPLTALFAGLSLVAAWLLGSREPLPPRRGPPAAVSTPAAGDLRAARMGRLWQVGEMTASLGHDFGQPLNIIRLTAEAALDALNHHRADPDRIRRSLNTAVDQTRRMQGMIDALLAGTRRPQEPPRPVQPVAVIRHALSLALPRLRSQSIRLRWHADLATPAVTGHGVRLEMAITHLLMNATDAMAAQALSGNGTTGTLRVSCSGGDGGVIIVVADNGPGFPPELRAALDSPRPRAMTGIGLTVALGIIAEMGGSVSFDEASPGTSVTIRLPVAVARRSVLVVDDETEAAREIGDYLAGQGWHVRVAGGGSEALRLFEQAPCDAVVTDLHMAEGDGWQLIENLHARAPDLAIIAVTAAQGDEARRAVTAGAVMVINKPVGLEQIAQELDELLA